MVVRKHERFALNNVAYDGIPIGPATVDVWQAVDGSRVWCARVLVDRGALPAKGRLTGLTLDGRRVSGPCHLGNGVLGPNSRMKQIIELLGEDELHED